MLADALSRGRPIAKGNRAALLLLYLIVRDFHLTRALVSQGRQFRECAAAYTQRLVIFQDRLTDTPSEYLD
ncbi:hypothetical protein D3C73_1550480 [compost metagenome]